MNEEQNVNKSFDIKIWKKLTPFILPYGRLILLLIGSMLVSAGIDVALPLFQRYAINHFILQETMDGIVPFGVLYFIVIAAQAGMTLAFALVAMRIEMYLSRDIRRALFVKLQELSFSYYNVTPVGNMLSRATSDTNRISGMIGWGVVDVVWASAYVIGVLVIMFLLKWKLAILVAVVVPLIAVTAGIFQSHILKANREVRRINSQIISAFNEGIGGARTSKVLGIEADNLASFSGLTGGMYRSSVRAALLSACFVPVVLFFSSFATAIVLARGGYLTMNNLLEFGTLSVFITYAIAIFEPIQQIARILAEVISVQAPIERVADLLEQKPDIVDRPEILEKYGDALHPKKENWEKLEGHVEFRDVTFRYPDGGENVLEHFNLDVPAGTVVAIVGETGAGKSTIVNLACRFFEPTEGQILIDGTDYRERSQLWLHSNLGYVLQSPHLFSGSIRENIRYGRLDATDAEVEAAARLVAADRIAARIDGGYEADVGEGGDRLSTGEKQLVSFARAVLADPPIFVLDEATSSIDTETEQLIQNAISHLLTGRTAFIIAHRLSTIRQADIILVVRDGKIIERGSHRELLRAHGYYYDLYTRQFEREAIG